MKYVTEIIKVIKLFNEKYFLQTSAYDCQLLIELCTHLR